MNFTHLHVHTEYSLLDGSNKIKEYVARVKELGMDSAAITDHGAMYGVIDFYRAAKAEGIKPIIGCEVYVAPGSRFDKEGGSGERYYHLVLLAENNKGYANLMKIVSRGFTEGFYYKPRVDKDVLREYHEGIIALSACLAGEVQSYLVKTMYEEAKRAAKEYEEIFGTGNFFLELQDHGIAEQHMVNPQLVRLSQETGLELVATNDVHYTYREDEQAHDMLLCIQTGKKLSDENRMRYEGGQYYVKAAEEMEALFPYAPEAIKNTVKIAQRCHVEIEFGVRKLPKYDVPEGYTSWEYLNKLCQEGLERRYGQASEELKERMQYELETIHSMGFVDYFLIVWDFINFAKKNGISVGPGRGSAAGSIVSYCLSITDIDPIKYSLLFERFLNPERVSMPDIDIDFCFERRQEVIDYVVEKYGKDRVVQIVTFGTMAAKGVIRDVGRVMDLPYSFVDGIAKMIPNEPGKTITIAGALKMNPEFKAAYDSDEQIRYLVDMSQKLEGLPRHTSMHAAGVVISQKAVDEYVPLSRASDGSITTQFTMTTLEELGLLKMDFLGLRTLTVIQNAENLVNRQRKAGKERLDMSRIDYDDKKVLASIATGRTDGIFQLESGGMKSFMRELNPQSLEDIIAGVSLYRPGPMDFIPQYIKGKNNQDSISYETPLLEPILAPTYGCIVYQEQVMQIVRELAGYTLGRSDLVRRAMSKKKVDVMVKERQNFIYGNEEEGVPGCLSRGVDEKTANHIFDSMMDFARYAFNKSHAAAYAVVAYQTAYLKYYYPVEFMAALLTSVIDNNNKVSEYVLSCRQMGIRILTPDVNEGEWEFSVTKQGIRYALSAIKSIGKNVIDRMVEERNANGKFKSLHDFIDRMYGNEMNRRALENLIKAGALDSLGGTRKQYTHIYAQMLEQTAQEKKSAMTGQMSLFDMMQEEEKEQYELKLPDVGEFEEEVLLAFEKEVLGVYISGHPLEKYEQMWKKGITNDTSDFLINEETNETAVRDGAKVIVGGMITAKKTMVTKTSKMMAFITIEDLLGTVEVLVFPRDYEKYTKYLQMDEKVFVKGRVSAEDEKDAKLICESVIPFEQVPRELWLQFPTKEDYQKQESGVLELLKETEGADSVVIYVASPRAMKRFPPNRNIQITKPLLENLYEKLGEGNVKVVEKDIEKL
ncbi:MAG: DNA polymerase III subunit alpha [Lachnospiraceae bacterium]|nr:DNA polymerase III subunit alpha [Lachnospiraceae bacterium]